MTALILYFSGTGNTKYVAGQLENALIMRGITVEAHSLEEHFNPAECDYDLLIIGSPKYYENPVLSVLKYLRLNLPHRETVIPTLAFCTQAGPLPTDYSGLGKILKSKNHQLTVAKSFPIANNMMIFKTFHVTEPETVKENRAKIKAQLEPLLDTFLSGGEQVETVKNWESTAYHGVAVACTKLMPRCGGPSVAVRTRQNILLL